MSNNKLSPLEQLKQAKTDEIRALKKLLQEIEKEHLSKNCNKLELNSKNTKHEN